MEDVPAMSAPFPRTSPTKRSFDVAFLTGVRDDPPPSQSPPSPLSSTTTLHLSPSSITSGTTLHLSPSSLSNNSSSSNVQHDSSPEVGSRIPLISSQPFSLPSHIKPSEIRGQSDTVSNSARQEKNASPVQENRLPISAFTKVTRFQESINPRVSLSSSAMSSSCYSNSTASLQAVTSFLSGNKNLAPLLASSGIFNHSLSPLFPPDRINNNFVEEYLKSQQNIVSKSSLEIPFSPSEALSRLRSSIYTSDPYKMSFGSLGYPLVSSANSSTPPAKINVPFIQPSPVASMIPTALNTLSLASQNVCAKCNISFRMTSDLVYHMRSQHKREQDPYKKRRNDRLKCSICGESFRERHHLTRHMTAHQDRSDETDAK